MSKRVFKYFFDFVDGQEKWLNEMAASGLRLVRCGTPAYYFEQCAPGEYQYRVEFVGGQSHAKQKDYASFLEGLDCRVIRKNVNLNWSFVKVRFRPWADGMGKIATSPGAYNKELLIVEKKNEGKPFDLHTNTQDLAVCFKNIRNSYFYAAIVGIVISALFIASMFTEFDFTWGFLPELFGGAAFALVGAIGIFFAVKYGTIAKRYKELGRTSE